MSGTALNNVFQFEYLGSQQQSDGEDNSDIKHRMNIAQATFTSLSHIWPDHRLPLQLKIRLYVAAVCSTFSHACEAWDLTSTVVKTINGFNSRCLHVITGKSYQKQPQIRTLTLFGALDSAAFAILVISCVFPKTTCFAQPCRLTLWEETRYQRGPSLRTLLTFSP